MLKESWVDVLQSGGSEYVSAASFRLLVGLASSAWHRTHRLSGSAEPGAAPDPAA